MAPEFSFRDSATLRRRLEVSSLLALRAVAQSAKLVQQPPRRARRGCDRRQCLEADLICNSRNCNRRTATAGTATAELQQPNCNSRTATAELQQPNYNSGTTTAESLVANFWHRERAKIARVHIFRCWCTNYKHKSQGSKSTHRGGCVVVSVQLQYKRLPLNVARTGLKSDG